MSATLLRHSPQLKVSSARRTRHPIPNRGPPLVRPNRHGQQQHRRMVRVQVTATDDFWWPLALSTMAGLSTSIGGALAVIKKPSQGTMAGLLGVAIGVMATISIIELIIRNAMENDPFLVIASALVGGVAYYVLEPFFPKVEEEDFIKKQRDPVAFELISGDTDPEAGRTTAVQRKKVRKVNNMHADVDTVTSGGYRSGQELSGGGGGGVLVSQSSLPDTPSSARSGGIITSKQTVRVTGDQQTDSMALARDQSVNVNGNGVALSHLHLGDGINSSHTAASAGLASPTGGDGGISGTDDSGPHTAWMSTTHHSSHSASLMRLGLLMAITMTLHNMPEGFAVAFSAYTDFGPVMAIAIALHNIPEGVIIAAPIYAATGSRWKALGLATASGLSEPLGAVMALVLLHPFITPERLHYMLACVGGLMLAVCIIELWPEARACRNDRGLAIGSVFGSAVMAWTLFVEG